MNSLRLKGSALIITILIITVIATISFAISSLTISEFRQVANIQDSVGAYYAAEAGLEHGLMQYRLWHDAEISKDFYQTIQSSTGVIDDTNVPTGDPARKAQAYSLTGTNLFVPGNAPELLGGAWYGLKMWYRDNHIGAVASDKPTIDASSPVVKKDSAVQISVPKDADTLLFSWKEGNPNNLIRQPLNFKYFVEYVLNAVHIDERVTTTRDLLGDTGPRYKAISIDPTSKSTVLRFKPWDMQYMQYGLMFKKGGESGQSLNFDTQTTYIEASGTVGKSKRKLRLGINRSTGTIIEASDFLLLSGATALDISGAAAPPAP